MVAPPRGVRARLRHVTGWRHGAETWQSSAILSDPRPGKAISHISVANYRAKVLSRYQVVGEYARIVVSMWWRAYVWCERVWGVVYSGGGRDGMCCVLLSPARHLHVLYFLLCWAGSSLHFSWRAMCATQGTQAGQWEGLGQLWVPADRRFGPREVVPSRQ